jgi:hypothetical protein
MDYSTQAKVDQYSVQSVPVAAQPAPSPYGTQAQPVQPTMIYAQGYGQAPTAGYPQPMGQAAGVGRPYPQGVWGDNICSWPENLFPSCYCVCCVCCGMYLVAQSKCRILFIPDGIDFFH